MGALRAWGVGREVWAEASGWVEGGGGIMAAEEGEEGVWFRHGGGWGCEVQLRVLVVLKVDGGACPRLRLVTDGE